MKPFLDAFALGGAGLAQSGGVVPELAFVDAGNAAQGSFSENAAVVVDQSFYRQVIFQFIFTFEFERNSIATLGEQISTRDIFSKKVAMAE